MLSFSLSLLWGVPQAFASGHFLRQPLTRSLGNAPIIDFAGDLEGSTTLELEEAPKIIEPTTENMVEETETPEDLEASEPTTTTENMVEGTETPEDLEASEPTTTTENMVEGTETPEDLDASSDKADDENLEPNEEISVEVSTPGQDIQKTEVNVELIEHFNATRQVTAFDIKVSLPESTHEDPRYFICSYLVLKKLPPTKMYLEDPATGEWVPAPKGIKYDQKNFVESEVSGHEDEVDAGTRMSCTGMLEIINPDDWPFMSLFDANGRKTFVAPTAADITVLQLNILNEDENKSAQLYYAQPTLNTENNEKGRFFLTGDHLFNDALFIEQGARNEDSQKTQLATRRRQLDYYKFRCRFMQNEKTLIIKITIVADDSFCNDYSGGQLVDCENNAMSIVLLASKIVYQQLNAKLSMDSFVRVGWPCDRSLDFRSTLTRVEQHVQTLPSSQRTALVHFFTSCMPLCWPQCALTLGLAYVGGMTDRNASNGRNIGVNRIPNSNTFTFVHEVGHSLGFQHYFGISNRNVHDNRQVHDQATGQLLGNSSFGVMDYVADQKLLDPEARNSIYNGLQQFTPRHNNSLGFTNSNTDDFVCEILKAAVDGLRREKFGYQTKFALEDPTTKPKTPQNDTSSPPSSSSPQNDTSSPPSSSSPQNDTSPPPTAPTSPPRTSPPKTKYWTEEEIRAYWAARREQLIANYLARQKALWRKWWNNR